MSLFFCCIFNTNYYTRWHKLTLLARFILTVAVAGTSNRRPRTFRQEEVGLKEEEEEEQEESGEEEEENQKRKGTQGIIEIENPNIEKPKNVKAKDVDMGKTTELSRREREEIEKQKAHERYMRLQEQGKTEQARKDLERLALIRQQRAEAAKKREEEKAGMINFPWLVFLYLEFVLPLFASLSDASSFL
ncbi:PP28 domain-containing protein [Citrus sinensis]|nr:PP28 domain-containing protein [Citrus sinensis]